MTPRADCHAAALQTASCTDRLRALVATCHKYDETDDKGAVTHWTLGALSFAKLSDDQLVYRLFGTFDGGTGTIDLVATRVGRVIVLTGGVSATTIFGSGQLQTGQLETATRKAVDKVTTGLS